jgi:hypothetical protein
MRRLSYKDETRKVKKMVNPRKRITACVHESKDGNGKSFHAAIDTNDEGTKTVMRKRKNNNIPLGTCQTPCL